MANYIHETAVVHPDAKLGDDNYIGPFCTVHPGVVIGNDNRFESHCSVGSPAEKHGFFQPGGKGVVIGDRNMIREFATINEGTRRPTVMGNDCVMLRGSHLSHDSILEDKVTVSCSVLIGGESYVMTGANLGLGSICHQYSVIGSYAMVGMGTVITKRTEIHPCKTYAGNPARFLKMNSIGLQRSGHDAKWASEEYDRWLKLLAWNNA